MMMGNYKTYCFYVVILVLGNAQIPVNCEFFSFLGAIGSAFGAATYAGWQGLKCKIYECCDEPWIMTNLSKLSENFTSMLYGQHLVKQVTVTHLKAHLNNRHPPKALLLSFHGWAGTGKNYVSRMIVESLFQKQMHSGFVKLFISSYDFPHSDEYSIRTYKDKIQKTVKELVSKCQHAVFIFDEIDKAAAGIIDAIKPFVDHHTIVDGVDYRNAIFILLSNTGANLMSQKVYEFWKQGKRDEITLKDLEDVTMKGAFNEDGGLKGSWIINNNLVSAFVPFLPLERRHVKLCIENDLRQRGIYPASDELINKIADQMEYYPDDTLTFSKTGCKRVHEKVDHITYDEF